MARFTNGAPAKPPIETDPVTSRRGHFWVGAEPDAATGAARGPMYVYWEAPVEVTKPYPIVLVHGGGGQGLDFLSTPDGRPAGRTLLVQQGWVVYVVDRPGHGRSPYVPEALGPMGPPLPIEVLPGIFVPPPKVPGAMPFAASALAMAGRSQRPEDPALLQFLASVGPSPPTPPTAGCSSRSDSSRCSTRSVRHSSSATRSVALQGSWSPMRGPTSWSRWCRSSRSARHSRPCSGPTPCNGVSPRRPMTFDPPAVFAGRPEPGRERAAGPGAPA